MPQKVFGGKSAAQAAADPALADQGAGRYPAAGAGDRPVVDRVRFQRACAASSACHERATDRSHDQLRDRDCPWCGWAASTSRSSRTRNWSICTRRADHFRHIAALRTLAHEVIARPSARQADRQGRGLRLARPDRARYGSRRSTIWTRPATRPRPARSTAPWDLAELAHAHCARRSGRGRSPVAPHSRTAHPRAGRGPGPVSDPGRGRHHRPRRRPTAPPRRPRAKAPGIVVPGAAAAEPGKIWTPGSDQPSGGKKSAVGRPTGLLEPLAGRPCGRGATARHAVDRRPLSRARIAWHMARALELAARGEGLVEPNPMVGCTIVRDGETVGEGFHRRFGGPHAEVEALRVAGARAEAPRCTSRWSRVATRARRRPCTQALIAAGVRRVVVAQRDPFPRSRGRRHRRSSKRPASRSKSACWPTKPARSIAPYPQAGHAPAGPGSSPSGP